MNELVAPTVPAPIVAPQPIVAPTPIVTPVPATTPWPTGFVFYLGVATMCLFLGYVGVVMYTDYQIRYEQRDLAYIVNTVKKKARVKKKTYL